MAGRPTRASRDLAAQLQAAGLAIDVTTTGAAWSVPGKVSAQNGWLLYDPAKRGEPKADPTIDFLTPFANLVQARDFEGAVEAFAKRWGVLGLCQHGLPSTHRPRRSAAGSDIATAECDTLTRDAMVAEPLVAWSGFSRQARVILRGVLADHGREALSEEDWGDLTPLFPEGMPPKQTTVVAPGVWRRRRLTDAEIAYVGMGVVGPIQVHVFTSDRSALAYAIRRWLDLGDVRPVLMWGDRVEFGFGAHSLFGALALRLAHVAANAKALRLCKYCAQFYTPRPRERIATQCCGAPRCNAERAAHNWRRKRAGQARERGDYGPRNKSAKDTVDATERALWGLS